MARASTSANRRNDIVAATIEVFAEIGYYRATTAQVAERARYHSLTSIGSLPRSRLWNRWLFPGSAL